MGYFKQVESVFDKMVERRFGEGAVSSLLKRCFNPTIVGVDSSVLGYENQLDEENRRMEEERQGLKGVCSMIERLFGEGDNQPSGESPTREKTPKQYISEWIGKITGKRDIQGQNDN